MRSLVLAAWSILLCGAAVAADLPSSKAAPPAAPAAVCLEKNALPTDVFGFNVGSDVNDDGAWSASAQYNGAFNARVGTFYAHTGALQLSYGLLRCVEIGPFLIGTAARNGGAGGLGSGSAFGGGVEIKYKFLGRDTHGIGVTADLVLQGQGLNGAIFAPSKSVYDAVASLFLDRELIAGRLYGGLNVSYDFNWLDKGTAGQNYFNTSILRLGAALAWQVADGLFVGADINHYRRYNSQLFGAELGYATFVGPNVYWQATPKLALTAAYNVQVSGRAAGLPGNLDLANFNRHLLKVKLAYGF